MVLCWPPNSPIRAFTQYFKWHCVKALIRELGGKTLCRTVVSISSNTSAADRTNSSTAKHYKTIQGHKTRDLGVRTQTFLSC